MKLTSHSKSHHAVAQVIGYYLALKGDEKTPPLVFVYILSEEDIQLVMFPFVDDTRAGLINAAYTKVPLWLSEYRTDFNMSALGVMYLVLRITVEQMYADKFLEYAYSDAVPKRAITHVISAKKQADEEERMWKEMWKEAVKERRKKEEEGRKLEEKLRKAKEERQKAKEIADKEEKKALEMKLAAAERRLALYEKGTK